MCKINKINKNNTITQKEITNTKMYSGSEPSCLLHPLPKITTWEFHYIHPEYSRVVLQRLTTQTSLGFKQAHQEPQLVSKAHQQPQMVSRLTNNLRWVQRLTNNLRWFQRLTNNLRWFQRLTNNLCWFQRLTNNLTWFQG